MNPVKRVRRSSKHFVRIVNCFIVILLFVRRTNGHQSHSPEAASSSLAANGNDTSIKNNSFQDDLHSNYVATTTSPVPNLRLQPFKNADEEFEYDMAALNDPATRMQFVKHRIRAVLIFADTLQKLLTFLFRHAFGIVGETSAREFFSHDQSILGKYVNFFLQAASYKLWDGVQLFFACIAVYAGFAAWHQTKFTTITTDYQYYDYISRSNDDTFIKIGSDSWFEKGTRTMTFIMDAINKEPK